MSDTNGDIRAAALSQTELAYETVEAWGGRIRVCEMPSDKRDQWEAACVAGSEDGRTMDRKNFRARLAVYCCWKEDGSGPVFAPGDEYALGKTASGTLIEICNAAMRLNHLTDEAVEELKKT